MKNIFLTLPVMLSLLNSLVAQVNDRTLSFGYYTQAAALHPLGNGRWLTLVHGEPVPGVLYRDTVVAVVFNPAGEILQQIYLPLPKSEVHNINSSTPLADGGFAVSVANDLCDFAYNRNSLLVINKDGTLRWSRHTTDTASQPSLLKRAQDGNLIGLDYNLLVKYSAATGAVMWRDTLPLTDPWDYYISDFTFVTGSDAFVAVGSPDLQYWENWAGPDSPDYQLVQSRQISPPASVYKVMKGEPGFFYTFDASSGRVFLFDKWWFEYSVLTTIPYWIDDMAVSPDDLYFVGYSSQDSLFSLLRSSKDGTQLTPLSASKWEKSMFVAYHNNTVAIAGVSGSGLQWQHSTWFHYRAARHLWVQTRSLPVGSPQEPVNAALVAVEQNEPLLVSLGPVWPWDTEEYYQFSGGKFRVQLRNAGNTILDRADVQIAFDWDESSGICLDLPVKQRRYTGLGLAPGESVWLDFGDIAAAGQSTAPTQLCFWVAAPNERPDADRSDDTYCHMTILSSEEKIVGQCSIFPNPADACCRVVLSAEKALTGQVYDITGRLMQEVDIPAGENTQFDLQTHDWPEGIYFLQVKNRVVKIVVQHR